MAAGPRQHPVRRLLGRLRPVPPGRADLPVALGVGAAWALVLAVASRWDHWMPVRPGTHWLAGAWLTGVLAYRTRAPRAAFWLTVLVYPFVYRYGLQTDFHLLPLLVATFAVTRARALHPAPAAVGGSLGVLLLLVRATTVADWIAESSNLPPWVQLDLSTFLVLAALAVSAAVLGAVIASLAERNAELRALQEQRAREAVAAERQRIARDLHDVVAHHLSAIVVRAQAADRVADTDPDAPAAAVRWIAEAGRDALDAMRSVVHVLHDAAPDADGAPTAPTPGLEQIAAVVGRVREAGTEVAARWPEPLPDCAPAAGLAVLRVAQEALTNVLVHSAAERVEVDLAPDPDDPDTLVLRVHDDGPRRAPDPGEPDRAGHGLAHMREHARAAGGTLTTGPEGPGWTVGLRVPALGSPAADDAGAAATGGAVGRRA